MQTNIIFITDSYKWGHWRQYLPDTEYVYSYLESRNGAKFNKTVFFGLQYLMKEYLAGQVVTQEAIDEAEKLSRVHLGEGRFNRAGWQYILDKHQGRLPVEIHAVAEGTPVPTSNVQMTVENADSNVPWLTNYLESILYKVWAPSAVATLSMEIKILLSWYLEKTADNLDALPFMLHDFGYRGAASEEAAMVNGAAHLINFRCLEVLDNHIKRLDDSVRELKGIVEVNITKRIISDGPIDFIPFDPYLYNKEYANINGIFLKRENERFEYCEHFTSKDASILLENKETRIPTKEEWKKMLELGHTWDEDKEGIWIGKDHRDKRETSHSTFLPADGCHYVGDISPSGIGNVGCYLDCVGYECLWFSSNNACCIYRPLCHMGASVRLIEK
jgi:hypothetical protein